MRIHFARHGESTANTLHVFSNHQADHPLTDKGRAQAAALADHLSGRDFSAFYSSPIPRAIETAQIISDFIHMPFKIHAGLREFDAGILEGRSDEDAWGEFSELWNAWFTLGLEERKVPGGESLVDIRRRLGEFLDEVISQPSIKETDILCITHGGLLYAGLPGLVENISYAFVRDNPLANTACVVIIRDGKTWHCEQWADTVFSVS
jgi:broad specificity phosphatase PhoE